MSDADRAKWDAKYAAAGSLMGERPRAILEEIELPAAGRALDVACGEGQNAVWLAARGLEVVAVDISPVGLAKARARAQGARIDFRELDLEQFTPPAGAFDLIVCTHYLERALFPKLEAALAPGGMFVGEWPLALARYPVAPDEPPRWFPSLRVVLHRHDADVVQFVGVKA